MPIKRESLPFLSYIRPSRIKILPSLITDINIQVEKNELYLNKSFLFTIKETTINSFKYNYHEQTINIENNKNLDIIKLIRKFFPKLEDTLKFIIFHEIGHAVQHSSLFYKNNPIQDSELEPFRFYNKHFDYGVLPNLNRIFSKTNIFKSVNNKNTHVSKNIHYFMRHNLIEAYADLYASYAMYLQDKNITIFDDLKEYRESDFKELKERNSHAVSRYENISTLNYFKQEALNFPKNIKFEKVHQIMQKCILKGLVDTMEQEYMNNPAFRNDFKAYTNGNDEQFFTILANESKTYDIIAPTQLTILIGKLNTVNIDQDDKTLHLNNVNDPINEGFCSLNFKIIEQYREFTRTNRKTLSL